MTPFRGRQDPGPSESLRPENSLFLRTPKVKNSPKLFQSLTSPCPAHCPHLLLTLSSPPWCPYSCPAPTVCPDTQPEGACEHLPQVMSLLCSEPSCGSISARVKDSLLHGFQGPADLPLSPPTPLRRPLHSGPRGPPALPQTRQTSSHLRAFATSVPSAWNTCPHQSALLIPLFCSKLLPQKARPRTTPSQ